MQSVNSIYQLFGKRLFDVLLTLLGGLLILPIILIISLIIKINSKGPLFYVQKRIGKNSKEFDLYKFRTMVVDADKKGLKITVGNDVRIIPVGVYLRKTKIDELPQLINVLKGDMSLVGPRPEVREFIEEYPLEIKDKILSIRPGITDMASIRMVDENDILGKYKDPRQAYIDIVLPIKQKHYLDYINNHNIWLDLKIIFLTFKKIFTR